MKLSELAVWAADRGYGITKELSDLAKGSDSETVFYDAEQAISSNTNRIQTKAYINRIFLTKHPSKY